MEIRKRPQVSINPWILAGMTVELICVMKPNILKMLAWNQNHPLKIVVIVWISIEIGSKSKWNSLNCSIEQQIGIDEVSWVWVDLYHLFILYAFIMLTEKPTFFPHKKNGWIHKCICFTLNWRYDQHSSFLHFIAQTMFIETYDGFTLSLDVGKAIITS